MIELPPPVTSGSAINDYGQVAAFTFTASGVYLWTPETANGTTGSLANISLGMQFRELATGMNSMGQITGFFGDPDEYHAFLWTPTTPNTGSGTFVELGYLPGRTASTSAADINALGQVVGSGRSGEAIATPHAFLWTPNIPNGSTGSMIDLGDLPGGNDWSVANGINARGQVVGEGSTAAGNRAFLWSPSTPNGTTGSMVNLGALPGEGLHSAANDINIHGQVVGYTGNSPTLRSSRAFLWTPDVPNGSTGTMIDLNSVLDPVGYRGWRLINATAINDLGQIVVVADDESQRRAFLLTPVPEPTTVAFIAIAALLLGSTARRVQAHHRSGK
jgi:probable HAF family extracellular repeat protein